MKEKKVLIISGPTASGKSELAKIIALKTNGVIINADSIQIYKELPILSSQPSKEDLKTVPHLLYSDFNHNQESSVAIWLKLVKKLINKALESQKLPIIVGGTGLYISSLINGINNIPQIDSEVREHCRQLYEENNKEKFINILVKLGENKDKIINLDKQRLIRHMEVLKQTGKTISWWHQQNKDTDDIKHMNFIHINLEPNREKLYDKCNKRFEKMLNNGAIEEVKEFIKLNPSDNLPITKTIGYFEIRDYLNNIISKEELLKKSCQKTRNYAKRQLTWFRNQFKNKITFQDVNDKDIISKILILLQ